MQHLDSQRTGYKGSVLALKGENRFVQRLYELGFAPGKKIVLRSKVVWGEPLIVELENISIALRREEARCILV